MARATPAPGRARFGWAVLAGILLAGPFVSHLHKSHHPARPHGDWYSIYSIGRYSLETGALEADEDAAVVRTQRYPPIARPRGAMTTWRPLGFCAGWTGCTAGGR